MAYWGTGTAEDPYICDSLESLQNRCNTPSIRQDLYIEMATEDQQGNPIPVEDRVIDLRKHDWYMNNTNQGVITIASGSVNYARFVDGKGWTILGASLRNYHLVYFDALENNGRSTFKNFTFKNVYLQGNSSLFASNYAYMTYIKISNIKASGVLDLSTVSDPTVDNKSIGLISISYAYTTNNPGFRFTACTFNFKFVTTFRLFTNYDNGDSGNRCEFNNCNFNIEGKISVGIKYVSQELTWLLSYNTLFFGVFYFCKFGGSIYYNQSTSDDSHILLYKNFGGTFDVIDFDIYPLISYSSSTRWCFIVAGSTISTNKIIQYCKAIYNHGSIKQLSYENPTNSAPFLHPADREEMCNEQWLLEKGFVIGSPPTE